MDRQAIFDTVVAHARQQGAWALGRYEVAACPSSVYRAEDGKKCFIGVLIPDELYRPEMEGAVIAGPVMRPVADYLGVQDEEDIKLLTDLQTTHDAFGPSQWETRFRRLSRKYSLRYTPPEKV